MTRQDTTFIVRNVRDNRNANVIALAVGRNTATGGWREHTNFKVRDRTAAEACATRLNIEAETNRARP